MSLTLAVNCGSSSIKFKVFSSLDNVIISGSASNVQGDKPAKFSFAHGEDLSQKEEKQLGAETPYEAVFEEILKGVQDALEGQKEQIGVVAHRIVHGGKATEAIVIHHGTKEEQETLDQMEQVSAFAPLHNHHAMLIVRKCLDQLPKASSVLCFDTLFHVSIPSFRTTYPVSQPHHDTPVPLRRYGFHGLSYGSIVEQMAKHLEKKDEDISIVVAHLGSGASVCLVQDGKSANTSMGLTPLEGLPGGTRSGSIDASLIFHHTPDCSDTVEWSGRAISKAEYVLNKESGFKALTGTNDFGEITTRAFDNKASSKEDQEAAEMTYRLFLDRVLLWVSAYITEALSSSKPFDGLVFSGGIGEHASRLRKDVLEKFSWIEKLGGGSGGLDERRNGKLEGSVWRLTKDGSKVPAYVVETNEERECVKIARKAVKGAP